MNAREHIDWQRIEDFVGFGSPNAPYVFLGMEEGLSSESGLDADLAGRKTYQPYEDLYEANAA